MHRQLESAWHREREVLQQQCAGLQANLAEHDQRAKKVPVGWDGGWGLEGGKGIQLTIKPACGQSACQQHLIIEASFVVWMTLQSRLPSEIHLFGLVLNFIESHLLMGLSYGLWSVLVLVVIVLMSGDGSRSGIGGLSAGAARRDQARAKRTRTSRARYDEIRLDLIRFFRACSYSIIL
jgi:hypothetical protein